MTDKYPIDPSWLLQTIRLLATPLGEAAGATLAGYPEHLVNAARRYGECLVSTYVLRQEC
jgi:uncharacterized protein (DUF2336 family)